MLALNAATPPPIADRLLAAERWLRMHPGVVGVFSLLSLALIGLVRPQLRDELSRALTLAVPLAACAYSIGPVAGLLMGCGATLIWYLDAVSLGLDVEQARRLLGARLFSNAGVVVMAAFAAAAARARDRYLEAQKSYAALQADLVSAFSHDLRSPLTAITAYASMLHESADRAADPDSQVRDATGRILVNARRLNQLIADMLTASRSDSCASVRLEEVDPAALVADLRSELDHVTDERPVQLSWQVAAGVPVLRTDPGKFISILRNLVNNAVKYAPEGRIEVRVDYTTDTRRLRAVVEDTGPGIPPEDIPHLFGAFYRVERTHRISGFGLGLFIVKRFTDLLGGTVTVESQLGRGTRFVIELPVT